MQKFRFKQLSWSFFIFSSVVSVALFRIIQTEWSTGLAMILALAGSLVLLAFFHKFFVRTATFKESYLVLNQLGFRPEIKINYSEIDQITFTYDRFRHFYVFTQGQQIKLPPPAQLLTVEELFSWLHTQYPAINLKIYHKAGATQA